MQDPLPIIIFGGSDAHRDTIPEGFTPDDMLSGIKGAVQLPSGRCIAGELVARLRESGRFLDPILIGPRAAYEGLLDCEIVDVRGDLPATIAAAQATIKKRYDMSEPVAITACDVLPTPDELRRLLAEAYDPNARCGFWWQLVAAQPAELGASGWKPSYRIARVAGEAPLTLYPGHLVIMRPGALRLEVYNRFLALAYRYRNRGVYERAIRMTLRAVGTLLAEDLRTLASFRASALTLSLPYRVFGVYKKLSAQQLTVNDLETMAAKIVIAPKFHRQVPEKSFVLSITDIQSLAKDIDTRGELEEAVQRTAAQQE